MAKWAGLGADSHELRNLVSAALNSFAGLRATQALAGSAHFERLGRSLAGLESAAASGLRLAVERSTGTADLRIGLEETWIIMEPGSGMRVSKLRGESIVISHGCGGSTRPCALFVNLLRNLSADTPGHDLSRS